MSGTLLVIHLATWDEVSGLGVPAVERTAEELRRVVSEATPPEGFWGPLGLVVSGMVVPSTDPDAVATIIDAVHQSVGRVEVEPFPGEWADVRVVVGTALLDPEEWNPKAALCLAADRADAELVRIRGIRNDSVDIFNERGGLLYSSYPKLGTEN